MRIVCVHAARCAVCLAPRFEMAGIRMVPSKGKRDKWLSKIHAILQQGCLYPGEASKLSGALNWASQQSFKKLGRGMLIPIRRQIWAKTSDLNKELELALKWFAEVLQDEICEVVPWQRARKKPVHMFCDARGDPPRIAAVVVD